MRSLLAVSLALLLVAGPALAGSQADPEIEDPEGDVDIQHLVDADLLDEDPAVDEEVDTSADVVRAWVDRETEQAFDLHVELAGLPEDENLSTPLVEVWTHFTIRQGDYHLAAVLSSPEDGDPLDARFELYEGQARIAQPDGHVDVDQARLSATIAKADVRDPGDGDELSAFHVTTHAPGSQAALDYAPDADTDSLPALEEAGSTDPTALDLAADATFGDTYAFSSFEETPSRISVDLTPEAIEIEAGDQASVSVLVHNDADEAEDVQLSASETPPGWSARVQPDRLTVPGQGSAQAELSIVPADDADGHELLHLRATGERGADRAASVSVTAAQPATADGGSGSQGDAPAAGGSGSSEDPASGAASGEEGERSADPGGDPGSAEAEEPSSEDEADEVPLPAPLVLVGLLLAVGLRRR